MNTTTNTIDSSNSLDAIKEAHELCYEVNKLEQYYDKWSGNYDHDVSDEDYLGPEYIANYLVNIWQNHLNVDSINKYVKVLDAGCGTGLVGQVLYSKGFQNIDGFDLSHRMVEIAKKTQAYCSLTGGCDMTSRIDSFPNDQYQATVCCGVFTLGHVPPIALEELIRITKPGGLLLVSTRKSYYDTSDFQATCDRLQKEDKCSLIDSVMDGPYIAEEGAHYWAFQVS